MRNLFLILSVLCFSVSLFAEPDWYNKPPKKAGSYYFAGVGRGNTEVAAKNMATGDVFSQIVYMVNASVTSNSSMETYIEENQDSARKESAIYKKVRAKGDANIENYEEMERASEKEKGADGKTIYISYVLAKIPATEIEKARQRAAEEKEKRKNNPIAVFAYAVFPNGNVMELENIKAEVEELYRNMGYSVKSVDVEFVPGVMKSKAKMVKFLKDSVDPDVKNAVICVVTSSGVRKEKQMGNIEVTSLLGEMIVSLVNLQTKNVESNVKINSKGISMRKDASAIEDAFTKLIKNLSKEFFEASDEGSTKKEDTF
jgi:hypothetical protein